MLSTRLLGKLIFTLAASLFPPSVLTAKACFYSGGVSILLWVSLPQNFLSIFMLVGWGVVIASVAWYAYGSDCNFFFTPYKKVACCFPFILFMMTICPLYIAVVGYVCIYIDVGSE